MSISQNEKNTVQITLDIGIFNELAAIAEERNRSIDRVIGDLVWTYKSERLARKGVYERMGQLISEIQQQSVLNGTSEMTMDEIDEEIAAARREAALAKTA
jgi:hypothetical protein